MLKRIFLMTFVCLLLTLSLAIGYFGIGSNIDSEIIPTLSEVEIDELDNDTLSNDVETLGLFDDIKSYDIISTNSDKGDRYVYLGGYPVGIDVKSKGLIVSQIQDVVTKDGVVSPCRDVDIKVGDIIISIDDMRVFDETDVRKAIKDKKRVKLTIDRDNNRIEREINTVKDVVTDSERIGIWLKDGITGIGTMTYIDPSTRRYGALGHPIEKDVTYRSGNIFDANIYGLIKGEKGKAGELNGSIDDNIPIGTIEKNTNYGIFGTYLGKFNEMKTIKVASRDEIKHGKAYIYTTIDGNKPKMYEIEIIKKNPQVKPQNKGMVIRIIDRELLSKTNGILQGMSGSPIIQNNKLIGAVTHVFINDPTKGFGVYLDFMLGN